MSVDPYCSSSVLSSNSGTSYINSIFDPGKITANTNEDYAKMFNDNDTNSNSSVRVCSSGDIHLGVGDVHIQVVNNGYMVTYMSSNGVKVYVFGDIAKVNGFLSGLMPLTMDEEEVVKNV